MKFNCGPAPRKTLADHHEWRKMFAWWPVRVGKNDCRWLEYVEAAYPMAWVGPVSGRLYEGEVRYRELTQGIQL